MKLVIDPPVDPPRLSAIRQAVPDARICNAASPQESLREISDADCFFGKITPALLDAASQLRWIQSPTASLEHYLFPELVEHPSVLTNMRGLFSDVIADQVVGYMLCFARNLHRYIRQQQQRVWAPIGGESNRSSFQAGPGVVSQIDREHRTLQGQTLGIVGLGEIGRELARRANAFDMRVVAVDPQAETPELPVDWVAHPDQIDKLLSVSDYVVVAAPHTPETVGMFGAHQFRVMRSTAYLINIGRGALVQLEPLVESLRSNEIAGAALDVFEHEPLPGDHPLWDFENVLITPHIAGYAPCIASRHLDLFVDNLIRFRTGRPLRNRVDKRRWY